MVIIKCLVFILVFPIAVVVWTVLCVLVSIISFVIGDLSEHKQSLHERKYRKDSNQPPGEEKKGGDVGIVEKTPPGSSLFTLGQVPYHLHARYQSYPAAGSMSLQAT